MLISVKFTNNLVKLHDSPNDLVSKCLPKPLCLQYKPCSWAHLWQVVLVHLIVLTSFFPQCITFAGREDAVETQSKSLILMVKLLQQLKMICDSPTNMLCIWARATDFTLQCSGVLRSLLVCSFRSYQYFLGILSIPISISIICKASYQYQYQYQ